jgi:urease alpha subunit
MYGPSVDDGVPVGDTNLLVEVERDEAKQDDEALTPAGSRPDHRGKS